MANDIKRWLGHRFSTGCETGKDYLLFQKEMKADLRRKAEKSGCDLYKFLGNHYEFSAVLQDIKTGRFIYVGISDVRFWPDEWYRRILYRTMESDYDWKGGINNYCSWNKLPDSIRALIDKEEFYEVRHN